MATLSTLRLKIWSYLQEPLVAAGEVVTAGATLRLSGNKADNPDQKK